jgi:ethylene receptor
MLPNTATSFQVTIDIISDVLTAIAYFSIPLELLYFLKHYPTTIPNKYKSLVFMFALFIVLCGYVCLFIFFSILIHLIIRSLTHAFNALRFGIGVMLCTKFSTAVISVLTATVLFILIPGVLEFLSYAKALEEEVMVEPDSGASSEVKAYLNK